MSAAAAVMASHRLRLLMDRSVLMLRIQAAPSGGGSSLATQIGKRNAV
jgi:hypothetical protein